MKFRRFETRGLLLLLLGFVVLSYLISGWASHITTRTNCSCKETLNAYQFNEVDDNTLIELVKTCHKDGINFNDNGFNFDYLNRNLKTFKCPRSWEYLSIPKPLVALASYPGSGNTWTRELIETVTGLHTGSIYTDWNFVGSKMCPVRGKVFIIKTHRVSNKTNHSDCLKMGVTSLNYSKAILILRNPYNALLAEFNRQNAVRPSNKTYFNAGEELAPASLFNSEKWKHFVRKEANLWKDMALYWLDKFERPVHVLVYELVRENSILEMYDLTKFVNISVPFRSLYCLSSNTTGNYHRVKPDWMTKEKLYDKEMSITVNTVIETVNRKVGKRKGITDILHSYLLTVN